MKEIDARFTSEGNKVVSLVVEPLEWQQFISLSRLLYSQNGSQRIRDWMKEQNKEDLERLKRGERGGQ